MINTQPNRGKIIHLTRYALVLLIAWSAAMLFAWKVVYQQSHQATEISLGSLWLFGFAFILVGSTWIKKHNDGQLRAEAALRASESRYRGLFEDSPISLWEEDFSAVRQKLDDLKNKGITDIEAFLGSHPEFVNECLASVRVIDINRTTLKLYHVDTKDHLLTNLDKLIPSDSQDGFLTELIHISNGERQFEWEGINQTLIGERINVRLHWSVVPGYEETLSKVMVSLEDISARKRTEEELAKAQALLLAAVEQTSAGLLIADAPDGKIRLANSAALGIRGETSEPLTEIPLELHPQFWQTFLPDGSLVPPDELPLSRAVLRGESSRNVEIVIRRMNGDDRWVLANAAPVRNAQGEVLAGVVVFLDITERKLAEKALRESEQLFSVFMDNLPAATFIKDDDRLVHSNKYLQDLFGWQECAGKTTYDLLPPEIAEQMVADDKATLETGHRVISETVIDTQGKQRIFETHKFPINIDGHSPLLGGIAVDVTERNRAESEARRLASKLKLISSAARQISALRGVERLTQEVVSSLQQALGLYNANLVLLEGDKLVCVASFGGYQTDPSPDLRVVVEIGRGIIGKAAQTGQAVLVNDTQNDSSYVHFELLPHTRSELAIPIKSGERLLGVLDFESDQLDAFDTSDVEALSVLADQLAVALENAQLFEETSRRAQELEALSQVSGAMRGALTRDDMIAVTLEQATRLFTAQAVAISLKDSNNGSIHVVKGVGNWEHLTDSSLPQEWPAWEYVIATGLPYVNNSVQYSRPPSAPAITGNIQAMACVPLISQEKTIGALAVGRNTSVSDEELRVLTGIGDMIANAIQRSSLHEQTRRHAEQMASVSEIGRSLAETLELDEVYARLAAGIQAIYSDAAAILISKYDAHNELILCEFATQEGQRIDVSKLQPIPLAPPGEGTQSLVIRTRQPLTVDNLPARLKIKQEIGGSAQKKQSAMYAPLLAKGEVLGLIQVQSTAQARFNKADSELLMLLANTGAIAIENARLFSEIRQRVQRLGALRAMDMAISSSFDLRVTLNVLLDQVTAQLNVDAACVLLYNAFTRTLEYAAGRGFRSGANGSTSLRLDQSLAGKAAMERRMIHIPNLHANKGTRPLLQPVEDDSFVAYYAIPLIAKGQVKGVLEIYNRSNINPDPEWMEFLDTLAGDTAIAVDNTALFNDLQRSNIELTLAYDRTLEGWSRALELRDEETQGHSQRVTEMTMRLGQAIGMSEAELLQMRRGALLHDIGKMGVPDRILHKTGALTEEEWEIMRQHPVNAFELLSRIPYLKSALEIPYYHHERWDGNGYPNKLKGDQIPLAARIFAAVDVWDALLSERPYRSAWPDEDVLAHLRKESGHHFDPRVVEVFLRLLDKENS